MASLRTLFGGDENPGFGQTHKVGNVTQPLLYVCGKQDTAILCDRPYALATEQYCEGNYTFLDVRPARVSHARRVRPSSTHGIKHTASVAVNNRNEPKRHRAYVPTLVGLSRASYR